MRVIHPDDTRLILEKAKPADLDYHMVDLPEGLELQSQFTVNNMVSTVASLSLDDVNPRSEIPFDQQPVVTAVFETFDGLEGTVKVLRKDEKDYVQVSAAFNADLIWKPEPEEEPAPQADGQTEPKAQDKEDPAKPEQPAIKPEAGSQSRNRSPEQAGRGMGLCHPQIPRRGHPQKTPRPPQNIRQLSPARTSLLLSSSTLVIEDPGLCSWSSYPCHSRRLRSWLAPVVPPRTAPISSERIPRCLW